jgi:hypothetical protein
MAATMAKAREIVKEPAAPRPVSDATNGNTPAGPGGLPVPRRTGYIPVAQIVRDQRVNTRPVDDTWVRARVSKFRPEALGLPAVSLRADGSYVVLDGQNRVALARLSGWADNDLAMIECQIYEGLDLAQEAGLFVLLNDSRAPKAIHKFLARITEGEPVACQIAEIAERCSWRIAANPGANAITAVSTLERIHRADLKRSKGATPEVLERALSTIAEAWQRTPGASHEAIIGGIGTFYLTYGQAIDKVDLVRKLAAYEGGPVKLGGDARGLREYRGGNVANCVTELVWGVYNKGRKTRKLPPFR